MNHYRKWQFMAPLGLSLTGLGASLLGHSIGLKIAAAPVAQWFWWGTLSLIVFNSGLAVFGDAVKHRTLFERQTTDRG